MWQLDRNAEWALALKISSTLEVPFLPRHRVGLALAAKDLGDAKVTNLDNHAVFVKKDVLGLEVAVQDEVGVHMMQCEQDLYKEVQDGLLLQQRITALLDELSQGATCSHKGLVKIQAIPYLGLSFYEMPRQGKGLPESQLASELYTSDPHPSPQFQGWKLAIYVCLFQRGEADTFLGARPLQRGWPTWCIFHGNHEGLVLQEILIVLNNIGVVEELEDLALILGCLPLFLSHLFHWDLLDDHQLLVSLAQAQVHNPGDTECRGEHQQSLQPLIR